MQNSSFDLSTYCARIGYRGAPAANIDALRELVTLHTRNIPFENLNPWLGLPVEIDLDSVARKLVGDGRGGYCYEQNTLMRAALQAIGIEVTGLAARVLWQRPADAEPAQSHMMLCALLDGVPYLVDVGFGGQSPTAPLRLDTGSPQATAHGSYRVTQSAERYLVEVQINGVWVPIYSFDLQPQLAGDYKVFNWYCATHPQSRFVTELIGAIATEDGRYALLNNNLSFYPRNGSAHHQRLESVGEIRQTLTDTFRLKLPPYPALDEQLHRMLANQISTSG